MYIFWDAKNSNFPSKMSVTGEKKIALVFAEYQLSTFLQRTTTCQEWCRTGNRKRTGLTAHWKRFLCKTWVQILTLGLAKINWDCPRNFVEMIKQGISILCNTADAFTSYDVTGYSLVLFSFLPELLSNLQLINVRRWVFISPTPCQ